MLKNVLCLTCFLTLFLLSWGLTMANAQKVQTLPNGMQVVVDEDPRFPLVALRLYVRAGSGYEQPGQEGISHFLEHMAFKGGKEFKAGEAARVIEEAGGSLNAATSFDFTRYTVNLPAQKLELGLEVLRDLVSLAEWEEQDFLSEKQVVLAEIQRAEDNPRSRLFYSLQSQLWQDQPYSHPILGFNETVKDMKPEDLKEYQRLHYQPQSMVLAVSGNVESQEVLEQARELFGDAENRTPIVQPEPLTVPDQPQDQVRIQHGPWQKAYLALALPVPDRNSPQTTAIRVLAHILGGDSTSLLYQELKHEKGLVDEISTRSMHLDRSGMLYFYVQLSPDQLEPFWEQFTTALRGLSSQDISREQLQRAQTSLEEQVYRGRETLGSKASQLGSDLLLEKDVRAQEHYLHELTRITLGDLQEAIDSHLRLDRAFTTVLLPEQVHVDQEVLRLEDELDPTPEKKAEPEPTRELKQQVRDLGQGRKLVLLPDDHLPYTAVSIAWPGGNRLLSPEQQGLAQLTASALTRETESKTYTQIQEYLKDRGASMSASAGRDTFSLSARFPVRYSGDMYDLIQEVITRPSFSREEFQRARDNQIASIKEQEDRPTGYAFRHLFPFLFQAGHYSYLHLGREDHLRQANPQELKDFWQKQKTAPFVISVSGQMDKENLDQLVQELKKIPARDPDPAPEAVWSEQRIKHEKLKDRAQAHIIKVYPVVGKKHEHTAGLKVLNEILAGQGGLLFRELRDKQGLAYSVTSMLWQTTESGFLALYIGTFPDKSQEAVQGFQEVVESIQKSPPGKEDVERAANLLFGDYHQGRQTLSSRAGEASSLLTQGLELDFNQVVIERAQDVAPGEVQDLAQEYLDTQKSYLFRILPE